ncbi:hypothetical protein DMN91_001185 [Ooceraea biroi]|uniref:Chitin-binding type-2 domain-containing protein n=1 Tax=Ooceraea biroi TaxID=2015173 RepID=A0A3L8E3V9_OOCBI|nr:uncharacterized protein LOC105279957 [Ooceraea biroi]RLU27381.1 hypothetical protein DMN91_001185 [Ooceraea biroi]
MKGIHVIAIAFLASCTVISANEDAKDLSQDQSVLADTHYGIPIICPFPERNWWNTTTNLPHETDCTKFYKCFLGKPILQDCPLAFKNDPISRLHYNRFEQVCDWPWRAGCSNCPLEEDRRPPSRISNRNDNCNSFWECSAYGEPRLGYCEPGLCFSRTCQRCVRNRAGGYCDGRGGPICRDGQRKSHHCNCNKYYECQDEDWYLRECQGGLHFDPRSQRCTTPDEAGCM